MSVFSYLKLPVPEGQEESFRQDIDRLLPLAKQQPGFIWAEVVRPIDGPPAYVILSEWETLDQLRAWEHHPQHEPVMRAYPEQHERRRYNR